MNKITKRILTIWLAGALLLSLGGCSGKQNASLAPAETTAPTLRAPTQPSSGVQTILLMSLATFEIPSGAKTLRNECRADFLMLMTVDDNTGKSTAVQIDPDVLVQFKPQGAAEAESMPLGTVYTYGSGGSDSNLNILTAVSKLLGNQKIDHYMTFEADSIRIMTDLIGGISVDITDPIPEGPPELAQSGSVTLNGENADIFFNHIAAEEPDNIPHMRRQQEFIKGAFGAFSASAGQEDFATQLSIKLGEKMRTDLTLSQMLKMLESLQEYELDKSIQLIGKEEYAQ